MRSPAVATVSESKRKTLLASAHERLETAKRYLRTIQNRNKLITDLVQQSWDYDEARRNAARQKDLLQWLLKRMPVIGAEMTQGISQCTNETLQSNRGHDPVGYRQSKRRRTGRTTKPPVQRLLASTEQTQTLTLDCDADIGTHPVEEIEIRVTRHVRRDNRDSLHTAPP